MSTGVGLVRLYLLLVLILSGYVLVRKFLMLPKSIRMKYQKRVLSGVVVGILMFLALTGHLAWLPALIGVMLAFLVRNIPLLVRYAPYLHRMWQNFRASKPQSETSNHQYRARQNDSLMSVAEAYKILGLEPHASKQDIIQAHKKLIQKMHPDRGGSDYLAAQINMAKDTLMRH